jgi:hypothetical protein
VTGQNIVKLPQSQTVLTGSDITLDCSISDTYTDFFEWRFFPDGSTGGEQIYTMTSSSYAPDSRYPQPKYQQDGDFGLNITGLDWEDGGQYDCRFLKGDVHATANVIVIGEYSLVTLSK